MSQYHSQDQNDASKPNDEDASKVNNNDQENTQETKDDDHMPDPTPTSAQAEHIPRSQPLPTQKPTKPSRPSSPQHRSSSFPAPSPKTDEAPRKPDDTKSMPTCQIGPKGQTNAQKLPPPPQEPEPGLGNSKDALEAYDWDELEERFHAEMERCEEVEKGVQEEFDELLEVFRAWTATGSQYEEERGSKRLRTRIAFVQQSEKNLEVKRLHYITVVKAFENALALLSDP